jgi:hypothetical protein
VISNRLEALRHAQCAAGLREELIFGLEFVDAVDRAVNALSRALVCVGFDDSVAIGIAAQAKVDGSIVRTASIMIKSLSLELVDTTKWHQAAEPVPLLIRK